MIIEYLNESVDILDSKVDSGEITLEEAINAYDDIETKAYNEFVDEVMDAVDDGIFTATEAAMIFEMSGIDSSVVLFEFTDNDFDISRLTPEHQKEIMTKLNDMTEKERKKKVKELVKKYPSESYKKKVAKRNKIIGVGAALGAAALAGGGAYLGHKISDAENNALLYDKRYNKAKKAHAKDIDKANANTLYGRVLNGDKEAKKHYDLMTASQRRDAEDAYNDRISSADDKLSNTLTALRKAKKTEKGSVKYYRDLLKSDREAKKADKEKDTKLASLRAKRDEDVEYDYANRGRAVGAFLHNLTHKDKVRQQGITRAGIEKDIDSQYKNRMDKANNEAERKKTAAYSK